MVSSDDTENALQTPRSLIAVIPAAGRGRRLPERSASKELFPLSAWRFPGEDMPRSGVVVEHLLGAIRIAGVRQALVVTRTDKQDIPQHFTIESGVRLPITYVLLSESPSVPHSIAAAAPLAAGCDVVFGLPDILFTPGDAVVTLLERWNQTNCDILLGLFETGRPDKSDMVELEDDMSIKRILIKQAACKLRHAWILAVWSPIFTEFLLENIKRREQQFLESGAIPERGTEIHLGQIFREAIDDGIRVEGLPIAGGRFIDIGTPEDAARIADFSRTTRPTPEILPKPDNSGETCR